MRGKLAIALIAASATTFPTEAARAAVKQLDGTILPQPSSAAELTVVTSRGFASSADTLAGLFQTFAGGVDRGLDPVADASTTPGTFDPRCGLTVSIVLKGGACQNALGWYNASQTAAPPSASQIYPVVPANLTVAFPNGISCQDLDFCPLASRDNPYAGQHTWADPLPAFDPQIAADPNWQGGLVGFALMASTGRCNQTKYSQVELNTASTIDQRPWITALVYRSMASPGAVYLAFEDAPMSGSDWTQGGADGDFNDAVFFIAPKPCRDAGVGVDAATADASRGRDASADATAHRDAGPDRSATGGAGGTAGAPGAAGGPGSGGVSSRGGAPGSGGMSSSGGGGGPGGQTSATGGQIATGGSAGSPAQPAGSGGGCGCQSADGSAAGVLRWLILVALARLRRRPKRAQITRP